MKASLLLSIFVLGSALAAQTSTIVPKAAATKDPGYSESYFFYGTTSAGNNLSRIQVLYAASDVGPTAVWKSMQVRRTHYYGNQNYALTGTLKLVLSSSSVAPTAATSTYASNHGTTTTVINGSISLPARLRTATWPEPWETPIPFAVSTIYIWVPTTGGSLVVENMWSNNSSNKIWYVEGSRIQGGTRVNNLSACAKHSEGGRNNSISYRYPQVNGSFYIRYNNMPSNVPSLRQSFQILSLTGVGGTAYGFPLPVKLSKFFLPSMSDCSLAVSDDIRLPLTYVPYTGGTLNRGSLRTTTMPIPNNQKLAGVSFFDQAICTDTDPVSKQVKLYTSWSSKWTIGSGLGSPMAKIYRSGSTAHTSTTGYSPRQMEGPTLRFNQ